MWMSQLQMAVEEEQQGAYRSTLPAVPATNEVSPSLNEIPIAARQVRPDEFLVALAAIDARKHKKAADSLPLGEVLEQIQADVTAEEVWQEVYAERLKARKSKTALRADAAQRRKRFWTISASLTAVFTVAVLLRFFMGDMSPLSNLRTLETIPPGSATELVSDKTLSPSSTTVTHTAAQPIPLVPLLRNGGMVRMRLENLSGLRAMLDRSLSGDVLASTQLSKAVIDPSLYTKDDWMVYFNDGKAYLRGWIVIPPVANKVAVLAQKVQIYNRYDHPAIKTGTGLPITIHTDGIHNYTSYSDGEFNTIQTRLTRLDAEAWKGWSPLPLPEKTGLPSSQSGAEL
jgi:hypothetical protein